MFKTHSPYIVNSRESISYEIPFYMHQLYHGLKTGLSKISEPAPRVMAKMARTTGY